MPESTTRPFGLVREILVLAGLVAVCLGVGAVGGAITSLSVDTWYADLRKPPFNPPNWIFAPVWTALYVLMAVAAWRAWRRAGFKGGETALLVFTCQLFLNLTWSALFFGFKEVELALIGIVVLLVLIVVNTRLFWRIDRLAGALFVPYAAWVAFATALNAAIWVLN